MSANGNPAVPPNECPVCQDPFDSGANQPKVFGVCGHIVCAVCVPGCIRRTPGRQGRAKCPLCRQETPVPPNGLPTIYLLKDMLESQQVIHAASIKCSGCGKNSPSSDAYACKTCTATQSNIVVVCASCGMKAHRAHDVVDYDALAKAKDIDTLARHERQHNDMVLRHTEELTSLVANEIKRIAKDCQVDAEAIRPLSLMTKEEHEGRTKTSSDRRIRSTRTLDAAAQIIIRCHQELSKVCNDDAPPSGVQQSAPSKASRIPKRAAQSTGEHEPGSSRAGIKIARRAPTPFAPPRFFSTSSDSDSDNDAPFRILQTIDED